MEPREPADQNQATSEVLAGRFAQALGEKDAAGLEALLHPELDMRGLTPGQTWEAASANQFIELALGTWFGADDHIDEVVAVETASVGGRYRVGYRFVVRNDDGPHLVEQQAYVGTDGERINWLRIVCAGYQPMSSPS